MNDLNPIRNGGGIVLLLTACIDPGAATQVQRKDCLIRLRDYEGALDLWYSDPAVPKIVFCENSGYDLSQLRRFNISSDSKKCVELLSFHGNSRPERGKGYGEMEILDYALANSRLIKEGSWVLKVTGRLYVRNIGALIQHLPDIGDFDVLCDLRRNLSWADSRIFLCSTGFIQTHLLPLKERLNDSLGITFEHVLAQAAHRALAEGRKWGMIPRAPDIMGISGTLNARYPDSVVSLVKREIFRWLKSSTIAR